MNPLVELLSLCHNILPGYRPPKPMKEMLLELAESVDDGVFADVYGRGDSLAAFEAEVATLFGKEAAVFMPSGTMAQQIALRIWAEESHNFYVAMHPTSHLEFAEHAGYQMLHQMKRLQFGAPEFLRNRMLIVKDFEGLGQKPGSILLELPYRPLSYQLPTWDELLAIRAWVTERGIRFHLDGARIWQCRPFYQKTYAEMAALFDSLYVSFYKDLGGLCGSMLLGSREFIAEARVWQVRHGGRLRTQGPFWASAKVGLHRVEPQIDQWVAKTQDVAAVLSTFDGIAINPNPPHVNAFELFIKGDPEHLTRKHHELAKETGTFLFFGFGPSPVPGIAMTEMLCSENSLKFNVEELAPFMERLLS